MNDANSYPKHRAPSRTFLASLVDLHDATWRREANNCAETKAAWNAKMAAALSAAETMLAAAGIDADDGEAVDRWFAEDSAGGSQR